MSKEKLQKVVNILSQVNFYSLNQIAQDEIRKDCGEIANILINSLEYFEILLSGYAKIAHVLPEESLKILNILGHEKNISYYENEVIEIIEAIIYLKSSEVINFIFGKIEELELGRHIKFSKILSDYCEYTRGKYKVVQYNPQIEFLNIIDYRYAKLNDSKNYVKIATVLVVCLKNMLSLDLVPAIFRQSWNKFEISTGYLNNDLSGCLVTIREKTVLWLFKLFMLNNSTDVRCKIISALNNALHCSGNKIAQRELINITAEAIFNFYIRYLDQNKAALEVIHSIDYSVRNFNHFNIISSVDVNSAVKVTVEKLAEIKELLFSNQEYKYYCVLIWGYDLTTAWKDSNNQEYSLITQNDLKNKLLNRYNSEVENGNNIRKWKNRLWSYHKLNFNDMAKGEILFQFLELLGKQKPSIAFKLFKFIWESFEFSNESLPKSSIRYVNKVSICLLSGVLQSEDILLSSRVERLLIGWSSHANHLALSMNILGGVFFKERRMKKYLHIFSKICNFVIKKRDLTALHAAIKVVLTSRNNSYRRKFISLIKELNNIPLEERVNWIYNVRPQDLYYLSSVITSEELQEVFINLEVISEYTSEVDWLFSGEKGCGIASKYPEQLVQFLYKKYNYSIERWLNNTCNILSKNDVRKFFSILYELFLTETNQNYNYRFNNSINLLSNIFKEALTNPNNKQFMSQLINYVCYDNKKVEFVINILGNVKNADLFSEVYIKIFQKFDSEKIIKAALESLYTGLRSFSGFDGRARFYSDLSALCKKWQQIEDITLISRRLLAEYSDTFQKIAEEELLRSKRDIATLKAQYGDNL